MTSRRTVITEPDGKQTVITQETRGCGWWLGTWALLIIVIGGAATVSPLLAAAIVVVLILASVITQITDRRAP